MQVDPLTYRKLLILVYMIPALVLVMSGVTYITTNNMAYNSMTVILDEEGKAAMMIETQEEISKHRMNALVLIIVGFLISFILIGKNKTELRELKKLGKESPKE